MFEKIIGNNKVKEFLKSAIETNNVSHSYMFVGKSGIGKKMLAKEYAREIMCLNKEESNSEKCNSCIKFEANSNPDYIEIIPDEKTLKIDKIRKMQEKIAEKPIVSNKKVYIIDEADTMTEESQNCLLKTLEEPPEYAVIILIVSNESKMLPTIISRCVTVKFDILSNEEIKEIYSHLSNEMIELLEGSLENVETIEAKARQYDELTRISDILESGDLVKAFNNCDLLYTEKCDIMNMLEYLNMIFFKKRNIKAIDTIEKTKRKISQNNNYDMCIDYLIMNICREE